MTIRNAFSKRPKATGEKNTKPSLTVPNQTLGLRELLNRYTVGGAITLNQGAVYTGENPDFPDVSRMDPMERLELARNIRNGIARAQRAPQKDLPKPDSVPPVEPPVE